MPNGFMKSADGFLKKTKKAITNALPANRSTVDNTKNPTSAHSMVMRKTKSMKPPTKKEIGRFRPQ